MSKASLELGGGNWAAKDRKLLGYAVGDTSGKYIPREFDFTRNSDIAATRINKDGLIEKHRENVLLNSDDFSIAGASDGWGKNNATVTSGYAGYDGTTNAWKLESTVLTSYNNLNQNETNNAAITPLGSKVSTFSVYLKAGTTNWVRLNLNGTGNVYFDLGKGQVGTASSGNVLGQIEKAGNGFYRCSITRLSGSAFDICYIYLAESDENLLPNTHSTPEYIFVQHPQLEYGLVATDYLESGAATGKAGVLEDLPRIDYTGGSAQLLLEPQRDNWVTQSEHLESSSWYKARCTIEDNSTTSPEGVVNASKMTSTDASESYIGHNAAITGTKATWSFFAKKGDLDYAHGLVWDTSANGCRQWFNLSTGEVGGTTTFGSGHSVDYATIEDYGNGWYRCAMVVNLTAGTQGFRVNISSADTTITSPVNSYGYFYGLQAEDASYPTSYIPTYGTSVTRNVDVADGITINTNANHTMLYDLETTSGRESTSSLVSVGYDVSNRYFIKGTSSSNVQLQVSGIGVFSGNINPTNEVSGRNKIAVQWIDGTGYLYCNGVKQIDTLSNSSSSNDIDYYELSGSGYSHKTHQFLIFPTALTDSECIALTTL